MRQLDNLKAALQKKTRIVYFEPYANASMDVIDVKGAVQLAHDTGALAVVDNTWLSPYLLKPLDHGADLVIHSATKYMNGHGDGLGGIVAGSEALISKIKSTRLHMGGILSPQNAYLIARGIQTLPFRMKRHCENAEQVAEFLGSHPKVKEVRYAGLKSYEGHGVAAAQQKGFGGMLGFQLVETAGNHRFTNAVILCKPWWSLGDTKTLVVPRDREERRGIPANYVRLSVGLEDPNDIIADLIQALEKA